MTLPAQSILIVGGGFSGMCAAIQLAKLGANVDIVEIDENWRTDGAGLTVSGPSLRALTEVGVYERFVEEGTLNQGLHLVASNGDIFAKIPIPPVPGTSIKGGGGIMRPALAGILADATKASGANVRLGVTYSSLVEKNDEVEASFTDGSSKSYDLVIGADGLFSSVRKTIFPKAPEPAYTGQGVWRAVVPRMGMETSSMYLSPNGKVGFTPVSDELMYLYYTDARPQKERVPEDQLLPQLKALMEPFTAELVVKIKNYLSEDSQILYRPLEGILLPRPWYKGRITLMGDAVHATTPHLASGAGMGFEDAVVFAQEFAKGGDLSTMLDRYQNRRWERCRLVVANSKRLGEIELNGGQPPEEHAQIMSVSSAALLAPC